MSNFIKKSKQIIATILLSMMISTAGTVVVLGASDTTSPRITPGQSAGKVKKGDTIKFTIKDTESDLWYIYHAWDHRINGNEDKYDDITTETIAGAVKAGESYEFTITIPDNLSEGLHEFSIAAQDASGNTSLWKNIPYIIVGEGESIGAADEKAPEFEYDIPNRYPYNESKILPGMEIDIKVVDESPTYYIAYKWVRVLNEDDYATDAILKYGKDKITINAPGLDENGNRDQTQYGDWYLQFYARDGANNISYGYYTKVTVAEVTDEQIEEIDTIANSKINGLIKTDYSNWGDFESLVNDAKKVLILNDYNAKVNEINTFTFEAIAISKEDQDAIDAKVAEIREGKVAGDYSNWDELDVLANDAKNALLSKFDEKVALVNEFTLTVKPIENKAGRIEEAVAANKAKIEEGAQESDYDWTALEAAKANAEAETLISKFETALTAVENCVLTVKPIENKAGRIEEAVAVNKAKIEEGAQESDYDWTALEAAKANAEVETLISKFETALTAVENCVLTVKPIENKAGRIEEAVAANKAKIEEGTQESDYDWTALEAAKANAEAETLISKFETALTAIKNCELKIKDVNTSAVDTYVNGLVSTDYTNWEEFMEVVNSVKAETLQSKFDARVSEVTGYVLEKATVNTSAVDTYVNGLVSTDYTNWEEFMEVVNSVKAETLQSAFDARVSEVTGYAFTPATFTKTTKAELIGTLLATDYTEDSWSAFDTAIDTALDKTLKSEYEAALEDVEEARIALTPKAFTKVDKATLIGNLVKTDYTQDSWSAFERAIDESLTKDLISEYNVAIAAVNTAKGNLIKATFTKADKDELIGNLLESDYTKDSWLAFEAVIDTALGKELKSEYEAALEDVEKARIALTPAPFTKATKAELIGSLKQADYTQSSWSAFETAIDEALAKDLVSEYNTAIIKVNKARNELKFKGVDPDLYAQLDEYLATLVQADYTEESWATFEGRIDVVRNSKTNDSFEMNFERLKGQDSKKLVAKTVDTSVVDNYVASLTSTDYVNWEAFMEVVASVKAETLQSKFDARINEVTGFAFKRAINKSELNEFKEEVAELDETDYTKASWGALQEAIKVAENATEQDDYDTALIQAIHAKENLQLSKKELKALLVEIENWSGDDYTKESWEELQKAIEDAEKAETLADYKAIVDRLTTSNLVKILRNVKFTYGNGILIRDNSIINKNVIECANSEYKENGTIQISTDNGATFETYSGELTEGTYQVRLVTPNGISEPITFMVDLTAAKVEGVKNKKTYNVGQVMTLTDDNGIATVNLKLGGTSVPVNFEKGAKSITYTFTQVGDYTLELYDVAGNLTKEIAFTIE